MGCLAFMGGTGVDPSHLEAGVVTDTFKSWWGNLRALPVFAGFLSYRHNWAGRPWFLKDWPGLLRSNFTVSWVDVDNYEFQDDEAYQSTWRASANLLYFPTQNVRVGAEFMWGERINKDDSKGSATQLQISARYDF